jgi:hypothetical protein
MGAPTPTVPAVSDGEGWLALMRRHALLLLVVGPAALMVAVRWWLQWQVDRLAQPLPPALSPAGDPNALWLTVALVVTGCVVFGVLAWWLVRKPGPAPRWLRPVAVALWVLVWLAGTAQAVRSHLNVVGVQASQPEVLRLVGLKVIAASTRSLGGARLYLDWPAQGGLHTVLIDSPDEALLRQPARVQLQVAPGRWQGWYVTGWSLEAAPSEAPAIGSATAAGADPISAVGGNTPAAEPPRDKATP